MVEDLRSFGAVKKRRSDGQAAGRHALRTWGQPPRPDPRDRPHSGALEMEEAEGGQARQAGQAGLRFVRKRHIHCERLGARTIIFVVNESSRRSNYYIRSV